MRSTSALVFLFFTMSTFGQIDPALIANGPHTQGLDVASMLQSIESIKQQQLQNQLLELQLEQARRGLISPSSIQVYEPPQTQYLQPTQSTYAPVQQYKAPSIPQVRYITGGSRSSDSSNKLTNQYIAPSNLTKIGNQTYGTVNGQMYRSTTTGNQTHGMVGDKSIYSNRVGNQTNGHIGNESFRTNKVGNQVTGTVGGKPYSSNQVGDVTRHNFNGKIVTCTKTANITRCQ